MSLHDAGRLPARSVLIRHARPWTRKYTVVAMASLVGSACEAAALVVLVALATAVARSDESGGLSVAAAPWIGTWRVRDLVALGVVLVVLRAGAAVVGLRATSRLASTFERDWKHLLFNSFLRADWATQSTQLSGTFQNLLITDVECGRSALEFIGRALVAATSFAMMVVVAVLVSPGTALVMIGVAAALGLMIRPLSKLVMRAAAEQSVVRATQADEIAQSVSMVREIRVFGVIDHFEQRMVSLLVTGQRLRRRIEIANGSVGIVYQSTLLLTSFVGLGIVYGVDPGLVTSVGPVVLLLLRSLAYSQTVQSSLAALASFEPYVVRIWAEHDRLAAAAVVESGSDLGAIDSIELRDVTFRYGSGPPVLRGVSFDLVRGEVVGLIGPSGGGKSTLVQLLLRLRSPDSGEILVNGMPVDGVSTGAWNRRLAFVPQEPLLLNDTIAANVRFGRDGITDQAVERAARSAGIHDEIMSLPAGYDELAGEQGRRLSGGQRQRVCIARALVGEPDLLIVDEPTSALDAHSEHRVRAAFDELRGRVSVLVIAHRLTTLSACDRIAVLVDGRIQAVAAPSDLEAESDYFRAIGQLS